MTSLLRLRESAVVSSSRARHVDDDDDDGDGDSFMVRSSTISQLFECAPCSGLIDFELELKRSLSFA